MSSNAILASNQCSGCGVCVALCPQGCIVMEATDEGGWRAVKDSSCIDCGICRKICWSQSNKELSNDSRKDDELCFAGHAKNASFRWNGASGGCTTAFLLELFQRNLVSQVACVKNTNSNERLFEYLLASNEKEILECQKSAYYPTEISDVLRQVRDGETKTAIVGLPCVCHSIRNAMRRDAKLRKNIFCIVGLVCGQMKSRHYTDYLLNRIGITNAPCHISFREKNTAHHANDFAFHATDGHKCDSLFWLEGVAQIYMSGMFKLEACFHCTDVFADSADIVFMDAWLPEFSASPEGNNIIISRRTDLTSILETSSSLELSQIIKEKVLQSQAGVIELKQTMSEENLAVKSQSWNPFVRSEAQALSRLSSNYKAIAHLSNRLWANGIRGKQFDAACKKLLEEQYRIKGCLTLFRKIQKFVCHPLRTLSHVMAAQIKRILP